MPGSAGIVIATALALGLLASTAIVAQLPEGGGRVAREGAAGAGGGGGGGEACGLCGSCVGCWDGERTPGAHEDGGANSVF